MPGQGTNRRANRFRGSPPDEDRSMAKALERFTIARAADGYLLTIDDDSGDTLELTATFDQLDLITEELENALDEDAEEEIEVDDPEIADPDEQ